MPVKILPATGAGSVTVQAENAISSDFTLTMPGRTGNIITSADTGTVTGTMLASATVTQSNLASNIAGSGPAFLANRNGTNQTGLSSGVATKIQLNNVSTYPGYNIGSGFDPTTNYRFTPPVNGYYLFNYGVSLSGTGLSYPFARLYRNGSMITIGSYTSASSADYGSTGSTSLYLTTSDYIELYCSGNVSSGTVTVNGSISETYLCGILVRAA